MGLRPQDYQRGVNWDCSHRGWMQRISWKHGALGESDERLRPSLRPRAAPDVDRYQRPKQGRRLAPKDEMHRRTSWSGQRD